jgi:hypothetical protein
VNQAQAIIASKPTPDLIAFMGGSLRPRKTRGSESGWNLL